MLLPGQHTGLLPVIAVREGPLHFAGDHRSVTPAWIEGALESAVRAALEIHTLQGALNRHTRDGPGAPAPGPFARRGADEPPRGRRYRNDQNLGWSRKRDSASMPRAPCGPRPLPHRA